MIFIPLVQLLLFGYAINTNPKHLPTAVLVQDDSAFARSFLAAMRATDYFDIRASRARARTNSTTSCSPAACSSACRSRRISAATSSAASGRPCSSSPTPPIRRRPAAPSRRSRGCRRASSTATSSARRRASRRSPLPYELRVHRRYNPAGETRLNIVPGLMGTILTLTMLIFTALSVTREIERGTMESLLSMPIRPVEIMLGKIAPYVVVGGLQMTLILVAAHLLFAVPIVGSLRSSIALTLLFIVANLSVGYTFSTIATNQLQAMQMSFFFFLPNILLSGFMFPFRGMPDWAQICRRGAAADALPAHRPRHHAEGRRPSRDLQTDVLAMAAFTLVAMGGRGRALPADARLSLAEGCSEKALCRDDALARDLIGRALPQRGIGRLVAEVPGIAFFGEKLEHGRPLRRARDPAASRSVGRRTPVTGFSETSLYWKAKILSPGTSTKPRPGDPLRWRW